MIFSQVSGALRPVFTGLVGLAVGKGWISADAIGVVGQVAAFLVSVIGAGGWSAVANSASNLTQTVASIKDDAGKPAVKVLVSSTAPQGLLNLASDTSVPEVVHAASVSPTAPPPKDTGVTSRRAS